MSFMSLWPLFFLAAVPVIIILYILKPKGTDMKVSSNLLWQKLFKNRQSRTFFEKFMHELLMYLQILIMLLLILSLMAPYVMTRSGSGGSTIMIIDNSLSMQHTGSDGVSRLDAAKKEALGYVKAASGEITLISADKSAKILAANSTDRTRLREAISGLEASDTEGSMQEAYRLAAAMEADRVIILTDGEGAAGAEEYAQALKADVRDMGEESSNISLDYVSLADAAGEATVRFTNYSGSAAELEISLYDAEGNVLAVQSASVDAGKSGSVLFSGVNAGEGYIRGEISAVRFAGDEKLKDSLEADNTAFALGRRAGETKGILIGGGNTFVERAYYAVVGAELTRASSESAISSGNYNCAIYDAGVEPGASKGGRGTGDKETETNSINMLNFAGSGDGVLKNVIVNVKESKLTEGLGDFSFGVNSVNTYELPEWATSFMEADGKCVGYYGINGDHKEVVVGMDIRESDFPLKAEFPVFMAGAVSYLSDLHILAEDLYDAGDPLKLNPLSDSSPADAEVVAVFPEGDEEPVPAPAADTDTAGLYRISSGERNEYFSIRPALSGRDGRATAEDINYAGALGETKAWKSMRNILVILSIALLVLEWLLYVRRMNYKRRFYLYSRIALMVLLILALLGIRLPKRTKQTTTIFLVDMSVSDAENVELFDKYIDENLSRLPKNNKYAIVTFGRDATVDQFVTDHDMYMGLSAKTDSSATNFETALQRAVSMLPGDSAGRIVVLTDGRETSGNINNTAALFMNDDISLEAVMLETAEKDDAYVRNVELPATLHSGDSYYLKVSVESNYDTKAEIIVSNGGREVAKEKVTLKRGSNEFVFEEEVSSEELESYEVKVRAEGDECSENDSYSAYSRVEDAPKILVLKGKGESGNAYETVLEAAHVNVEFKRPERAPKELKDLLDYKAIILENVYIDELPEEFVENLEEYVKEYGGGFGACGGEDSYMLGGYNDTPVETVLPVNMELRGTLQIPSTAIVMVVDHSGSMSTYAGNGATYLDVAVEAAKRGVDNLRNSDEVGVLAFDDRFIWSHRLSDASDKEAIKDDIETITDGGGTVIKPALEEARQALNNSDAEVRHIILLTDGMGETYDFSDVTDKINRDGITLSTVAVGAGADTQLCEKLAKDCGGRYYFADADTDIPRIFAQEVYLGGDTYIKNGDFTVFPTSKNELIRGLFEQGWYNLSGYVAASPKERATELLVSGMDDPILCVWQYGLGKTFAWLSDVDGGWSAAYSGEENYAELWKRISDYIGGTPGIGEDYVDVATRDGRTVFTYHTGQYGDSTDITGIYTSPEGEGGELNFTSSEPGVYTAEMESTETGLYNVNIRRSDEGEVSGAFTTATVVQYSDEYRFDITEEHFVSFISDYGNFRKLDDPVWRSISSNKNSRIDLSNFFLVLSILLFMADIAGRRFGWEPVFGRRAKKKTVKAAVPETAYYGEAAEAVSSESVTEAVQTPSGKQKKAKAKQEPQEEQLDMSALLKKKQERNL